MTPLCDRDGWLWHDGEWLPWRDARTHLLPLRELDGRHIGARAGAPTPDRPIPDDSLTARLQRLYHRVTRGELNEDLRDYAGWLTAV